jgi:hypothetical protein
MGLGMQIVYVGLSGSAKLEAQAGVQLLRLGRFDAMLSECRLVMELLPSPGQAARYRARLELMSSEHTLDCAHQREDADLDSAVRAVFEAAERELASGAACTVSRAAGRRGAVGKR